MKLSKFLGLLHVFVDSVVNLDAEQNPKQIRQTEKIFICRKFFGNNNSSGTSANKNYDRKVFLHFLIFQKK